MSGSSGIMFLVLLDVAGLRVCLNLLSAKPEFV